MNQKLPDVQAGFRKGRGTRDQIVNVCWIKENFQWKFKIPIVQAQTRGEIDFKNPHDN